MNEGVLEGMWRNFLDGEVRIGDAMQSLVVGVKFTWLSFDTISIDLIFGIFFFL